MQMIVAQTLFHWTIWGLMIDNTELLSYKFRMKQIEKEFTWSLVKWDHLFRMFFWCKEPDYCFISDIIWKYELWCKIFKNEIERIELLEPTIEEVNRYRKQAWLDTVKTIDELKEKLSKQRENMMLEVEKSKQRAREHTKEVNERMVSWPTQSKMQDLFDKIKSFFS